MELKKIFFPYHLLDLGVKHDKPSHFDHIHVTLNDEYPHSKNNIDQDNQLAIFRSQSSARVRDGGLSSLVNQLRSSIYF